MPKGLKINNNNSQIPSPGPNKAAALDAAANDTMSRLEEYKKRSWDLGTKFKSLIEDKFLPENKSPIAKDLEKEILDGLSSLATDINNDPSQLEGMGSVAMCQLIMKMMLIQRDTINSLLFRINKLECDERNKTEENEDRDR